MASLTTPVPDPISSTAPREGSIWRAIASAKAGLDGIKAPIFSGFTDEEIGVVARWLCSLQAKFPKGDQQ